MTVRQIISEYTWFLVLMAVALGFFLPQVGLIFKPHLNYLLMGLMIFSSLDISWRMIIKNLSGYRRHLLVVLIVHLVSPLLILFLKPYLNNEIFLGLILAATSTAGLTSIFLSKIYGGLPTKALVIVTISTGLSPIVIPWLVWLFAHTAITVDPWKMTWTILELIVIPIIISTLIRHSRVYQTAKQWGNYAAVGFLVIIIFGVIASVRATILTHLGVMLWLLLLVTILVLIDFSLAYALGRRFQEKVTYALAASYKNYALATVLAISLFGPMAALPATAYAVVNNLLLIPFQLVFLPKVRPRKWYYLWAK